ncbi:Uncharacterised protein [Bordetella pertussis]|nr:Uncharacterised protein [Bordetella pertussis]
MAWLALYGLGQRAGARAQLLRATDAAAMNCAGAASPGWTAMAAGAQAIRCRSMLCAPIAG